MSAARRHKKHHHEEHENHERWLVSGYDMMTLLFAVFVVLFAISSTNISKVKLLEQSLQEAFSGPVLTGGRAMMKTATVGGREGAGAPAAADPQPAQALAQAMNPQDAEEAAEQAQAEEHSFQDLKKRIDKLAKDAGLAEKMSTTVTPDGLKIRLVTDGVLFDSGSAVVKSGGRPTLSEIGRIIDHEGSHPVQVEGHTDDQPIALRSTRPTGSCPAPAQRPSFRR